MTMTPGSVSSWATPRISDPPFEHDVQHRVPTVGKARTVLGFEATTTLSEMLDEVIAWIRAEDAAGAV
jgi:UDP-glucose 4-epimerase